jgi:hypothetical protein
MASPIAGNESFTNVENVAGQLKVLDVNNLTSFNLTVENATVDPAAVYSDLAPTWEGLTPVLAVATGATLADNSLNAINFPNGGANVSVTLPSATVGNVCVLVQSVALNGGATDNLIINAVSGDVFATGSILQSTAAGVLALPTAANGTDDILTYAASTTAANNIWNLGAKLYFSCTTEGIWHINDEQVTDVIGTAQGTWTFSS